MGLEDHTIDIFRTMYGWWYGQAEGKNVPAIMHHYTGAIGLQGIIENQKIWATHVSCMNDPSELHGLDVAKKLLDDQSEPMWEILPNLAKVAIRVLNSDVDIGQYAFCLSLNPDKLSQWRGYTPEGGYSVGFDTLKLNRNLVQKNGEGTVSFNPIMVKYVARGAELDNSYDEILKELMAEFFKHAIPCFAKEDDPGLLAAMFIETVRAFAVALKDDNYIDEEEVRFVNDGIQHPRPKHRPSGKMVMQTPYVELEMKNQALLPIYEIIMGPGLDFDLAAKGVETLLKSAGYTPVSEDSTEDGENIVRIKRSKIQYRG